MDDPNSIRRYLGFPVVLCCLVGLLAVLVGYANDHVLMVVLGIAMIGLPILVSIGYHVIEASVDDYWVIEPSGTRPPEGGPNGPSGPVLYDGPGKCPTCGGTLFYGRLNCPHCSAPVFRDHGERLPPEL